MSNQNTIPNPRCAPVRPLGDLAFEVGVTRAAIYIAADKGYIGGTFRTGSRRKIRNEAFQYHAERGYGRGIPPYGSREATAEGETASASAR